MKSLFQKIINPGTVLRHRIRYGKVSYWGRFLWWVWGEDLGELAKPRLDPEPELPRISYYTPSVEGVDKAIEEVKTRVLAIGGELVEIRVRDHKGHMVTGYYRRVARPVKAPIEL